MADTFKAKDIFVDEVVETVAAADEVVVVPAPVAPAPASAPVVAPRVAASADEWEVSPGVWQIVTPVTGAFTLPDGTWVRPTEAEGISRAAVPVKWIEYVKALKA